MQTHYPFFFRFRKGRYSNKINIICIRWEIHFHLLFRHGSVETRVTVCVLLVLQLNKAIINSSEIEPKVGIVFLRIGERLNSETPILNVLNIFQILEHFARIGKRDIYVVEVIKGHASPLHEDFK